MILESSPRQVERSEGFIETQFKIANSAHVMRILRTGIYSNKIRACIKETVSNAQDAHVEALIKNRPVEVILPNHLEPTFKVRDYGNSMTHQIVMELYSTYGLSTKSQSNDYIGMMGIGKFACFAYAPAFQVSCIQNNVKRVYNMYLDETDKGAIALLFETYTDEENGTEVSIEVKPADIGTFVNEARELFRFWEPAPIVKGNPDYAPIVNEWHLKNDSWGFRKAKYGGVSYVVMGGVPYQLNSRDIPNLTNVHSSLIDKALVIFAKIGDVDVSASREQVSYTNKTIKFVKDKLAQIEAEIKATVESKMGSINSEYEARKFWYDLFQEQGELNVVKDIIKGIVEVKYNGTVIGSPSFDAPFNGYRLEYYRDKQWNRRVSCRDIVKMFHIIGYVENEKQNKFESIFVDFGGKGKGKLRNYIRHWLNEKKADDEREIFVLQPANRQEFEEWLTKTGIPAEIFHNLDEVVKLPPKAKVVKEKSIKPEGFNCWVYDPEDNCEEKYDGEETPDEGGRFEYANIDFEEDEPGYYVVRDGKNVPYLYNSEYFRALKDLDLEFAKNPVIHIITSRYVDKCDKAGWIEISAHLKGLIQQKWDGFKLDSIYYSWLSDFSYHRGNKLFELKNYKKIKSSLVDSFFNLVHFNGMDCNKFDYRSIGVSLGCTTPNLETDIGRIKKEASEIWKKILDAAPLMSYIDSESYEKPEVLAYLQEKLNDK